ncbi:MAG: hypothetical protein M1823_005849 [Watsoniomyces obsoletus]|nr:MAG: hypothetical protein M1823_005849 [Watsoniomyces obsoletus]
MMPPSDNDNEAPRLLPGDQRSRPSMEHGPADFSASDDPAHHVFPPARITQRFHRKPGRGSRRSSAASSRRTSISSAHSHHSHQSHRAYPAAHSTHIAQHLRRASIMETRKARLADRAAHAEQVRLRAAMAKAASTRISTTSEERALAAERARQKYLAQVAAVCAEEVKRAKRVAEETKERREAEERKMRAEREERQAEADRRRAQYQRQLKRGRTTSVPRPGADVGRPDLPHFVDHRPMAAATIQRAWRRARRRRAVREFAELGLTMESVRMASFEDVGALLGEERVLRCTSDVLRTCELQGADGAPLGERTAVRTFLSAYLIMGHPVQVLSHDGEQEQDLVRKATDLLTNFEQLLHRMTASPQNSPSVDHSQSFSDTYHGFVAAFSAWKAHDADTLLNTMLAQYVELDRIWQTIKREGEAVVQAEYHEGIRENQVLLLARIKRLAGPERAKMMIRDAIRKARRDHRQQRQQEQQQQHRDVGSSSALPAPGSSSISATSLPLALDESGLRAVASPTLESIRESSPPAADPQAVEDLMRVMSVIPDNRTLVHELAINKEYRIEGETGMSADLRRTLQRATFDEMRAEVQQGRGERWIVAMTVHIRTRLLRLLTPGNSLHVLISEALDPAVVARECAMGSFSYEKFFEFMLSILPRLCAPFRDPDVAALAHPPPPQEMNGEAGEINDQTGDIIGRLARLMHVIDLLSLDYANFLLHESAPRILHDAPAYEERYFAQDLANGVITLDQTARWWHQTRDQVQAEADRRDPEGVNHPANRPSARKIYAHALTDLFIAVTQLEHDLVPETLRLDRDRIIAVRNNTVCIVAVGAIMLSAKNLLKRDVRSPWKPEAIRIWDILSDNHNKNSSATDTATQIISCLESAHTLPPAVKTQLSGLVARFVSQTQARQLTDPVMRLLFHRLRTHVRQRLLSSFSSGNNNNNNHNERPTTRGGTNTTLQATSSSSSSSIGSAAGGSGNEGLIASGMVEFVPRITELVEEVCKVGEVDRASHGRWYEEIAGREMITSNTSVDASSSSTVTPQQGSLGW